MDGDEGGHGLAEREGAFLVVDDGADGEGDDDGAYDDGDGDEGWWSGHDGSLEVSLV